MIRTVFKMTPLCSKDIILRTVLIVDCTYHISLEIKSLEIY